MNRSRRLGAMGAVALGVAIGLASASAAWAQEFVKVDDAAREQLPAMPFIAAAYGFIWAAVLAYVWVVARRTARVGDQLDDLRRRLDRAGVESPSPSTPPSGR